jgi:hypothetical protein
MLTYKGKEVRICLMAGETCHVVYKDTGVKEMGVPVAEVVEKKAEVEKPVAKFEDRKDRKNYFKKD